MKVAVTGDLRPGKQPGQIGPRGQRVPEMVSPGGRKWN